jgi:hypothetical protein
MTYIPPITFSPNDTWWRVQITMLRVIQFSQFSCHFFSLGLKYPRQKFVSYYTTQRMFQIHELYINNMSTSILYPESITLCDEPFWGNLTTFDFSFIYGLYFTDEDHNYVHLTNCSVHSQYLIHNKPSHIPGEYNFGKTDGQTYICDISTICSFLSSKKSQTQSSDNNPCSLCATKIYAPASTRSEWRK